MINFNTLHPKNSDWQAICVNIDIDLTDFKHAWQSLDKTCDKQLTDWLIGLFNVLFKDTHTVLVRGGNEPEYIASKNHTPHQIIFAHGYFQSALHEIAHWCVAGKKRRQLDDFGYWYCPDGRDEHKQRQFEQVEITPQATECLFTLALDRKFNVSLDNLDADFDTSFSTFKQDVYHKAYRLIHGTDKLSIDAKRLLSVFLAICQS